MKKSVLLVLSLVTSLSALADCRSHYEGFMDKTLSNVKYGLSGALATPVVIGATVTTLAPNPSLVGVFTLGFLVEAGFVGQVSVGTSNSIKYSYYNFRYLVSLVNDAEMGDGANLREVHEKLIETGKISQDTPVSAVADAILEINQSESICPVLALNEYGEVADSIIDQPRRLYGLDTVLKKTVGILQD